MTAVANGYASADDAVPQPGNGSRERKRGVPWTEEEHRLFLIGLQTVGKGDWRGISRNYVKTHTPTQVASHAHKYFLRRNNLNRRRCRSSLFDITTDSSKRNATNRSKLTHGHCSGSRSFLNTQALGDTGNGRPDMIDLWKTTHYKVGKGWIAPIAEKKYDDMVMLLSSPQQHTNNEGQSDDGGDRPQVLTADDVANEILGTRFSYYVGLGRGPKPPKKTCRASSTQHENVELRQMVQTQQS